MGPAAKPVHKYHVCAPISNPASQFNQLRHSRFENARKMAALLGSSSSLSQASFGRSRRFGADPSLAPYYREAWPADVLWLRANQRAVPRVKLLSPSNGRAGRVSLFLTLGDEMQPGGRWIRLPQRTRRRL